MICCVYCSDNGQAESMAYTFPDDFLFGTATAGFQVEMGCPTLPPEECEDRNSDWYAYITSEETLTSPLTYLHGDPPEAGPGHWELYGEDLDLAARELNNNAYRFSIEWSRIFPEPTDDAEGYEALDAIANQEAVAHYHDMLAAMHERGLEPLVTLNHYSLPLWIHDGVGCHVDLDECSPRGWLDAERTVREIAKFAGYAAREFGEDVDLWVTLNEPLAVFYPGYLYPSEERTNPPAALLRSVEAKAVIIAMIEAHARMYDAIKENDLEANNGDGKTSRVGIVYDLTPVFPMDSQNQRDVETAENVLYLYNFVFLNAVALGEFDENFDGNSVYREDLANRMDYLGVNYYNRIFVDGLRFPILPALSPLTNFNPLTIGFDRDYPAGLYTALLMATERYALPIIVTENGVPAGEEGYPSQASFMVRSLSWIARAIEAGAPVEGYFYWSLMDNYEWQAGMSMDFGLYAVDPDDPAKHRTPREAASVYARIAQARRIPEDLAEQYPICADEDGDGHCIPEDCDDTNSEIHPAQAEVPDNGIDDDCNGLIDEDRGACFLEAVM
jgi:beta-glucosidase/6-phospho-beta-glucosidase/beta-galactosidase